MPAKPALFTETTITHVTHNHSQGCLYLYRADNNGIISIPDYLLFQVKKNAKVKLWFEKGGEDLVSPCVVAWDDHMFDLKKRPLINGKHKMIDFSMETKDDYDMDPATRRNFNASKRQFFFKKSRERRISEINAKIAVINSIKVPKGLENEKAEELQNSKAVLIGHLKSMREFA